MVWLEPEPRQRLHQLPFLVRENVDEHDVHGGYSRWAETYGSRPNPLIYLEEPALRGEVARGPVGHLWLSRSELIVLVARENPRWGLNGSQHVHLGGLDIRL